ncbi:MAG: triose-phosphate isomerase [Sulfolobaceae archaeon]|nr:triose-phosphate isomerase [Sulfolobales archaeon]
MRTPQVLINFKAYENSFGPKALDLAKGLDKLSKEYGVEITVSVPATMISRINEAVEIPVFAQHVDPSPIGAHTGSVIPEMVKEAGAKGTLINHSEKRMRLDEIAEAIARSKSLGLETVVCVDRYELVHPVALLGPTAVLIEPPELIGSGIAVSKAKPEVITRAVEEVRKVSGVYLLAGAGITSGEDVEIAIKLGSEGVGVASAVMKAKDPVKVAEDLVKGAIRGMEGRRALIK